MTTTKLTDSMVRTLRIIASAEPVSIDSRSYSTHSVVALINRGLVQVIDHKEWRLTEEGRGFCIDMGWAVLLKNYPSTPSHDPSTEYSEINNDDTGARSATKKESLAMANAKVIGKHKDHEVVGELIEQSEGKPKLTITGWQIDGKPAPAKVTKGIVGKTFDSAGKAGIAVFAATHEHYGTPERTEGRFMIFKLETGVPATQLKGKAPAKAEKPAKESTAPAQDKSRKGKTEDKSAPKEGKVTVKGGKDTKSKKAKRAPRPMIYKMERPGSQEGVQAGKAKFWCSGCASSFIAKEPEDGSAPNCPAGHLDNPELAKFQNDPASASAEGELEELVI